MLTPLSDMPDESSIYLLVSSRSLTEAERTEVCALVEAWSLLWSTTNRCPASRCETLLGARIVYWAADLNARVLHGGPADLSSSELELLVDPLDILTSKLRPALSITLGEALVVDDQVVPAGPEWRQLKEQGRLSEDTLIARPTTVEQWRAGQLLHRLGEDAQWSVLLLDDKARRRSGGP